MMHATTKTKATRTRRRMQPQAPLMTLDTPGRLRVRHLMYLFQCSHTTVYAKVASGEIPQPDGRDSGPFWLTATIRPLFEKREVDHD